MASDEKKKKKTGALPPPKNEAMVVRMNHASYEITRTLEETSPKKVRKK